MAGFDFNKPYEVVSSNTGKSDGGGFDFDKPYEVVDPTGERPREGTLRAMGRGAAEAFKQIPQLGWGLMAGAAATGEAAAGEGGLWTGLKKYAVDKYTAAEQDMARFARPEDSFNYSYERAKEGDIGALMAWGAHGIGYVGGQAVTLLAGVGVGEKAAELTLKGAVKEMLGGMVAKQAEKIAAESLAKTGVKATAETIAKKATEEAIIKQATAQTAKTLGSHATAAAFGYGMEGGEIGGDLARQSVDENRALTGTEVFKGISGTLLAGTVEYAENILGLSAMKGKLPLTKSIAEMGGMSGRLTRGAMGAAEVAPLEAGQEYAQTGIEQWAKGQDPSTDEAAVERSDAAWLGALGGGMGLAGGILTGPKVDPTPDLSRNHTVDDVLADHKAKISAQGVGAVGQGAPVPGTTVDDVLNGTQEPGAMDRMLQTGQAPGQDPGAPVVDQQGLTIFPRTDGRYSPVPMGTDDAQGFTRLDPQIREMAGAILPPPNEPGVKNKVPEWLKLKTLKNYEKQTGERITGYVNSKTARETLAAITEGRELTEKQAKVWNYLKTVAEGLKTTPEQPETATPSFQDTGSDVPNWSGAPEEAQADQKPTGTKIENDPFSDDYDPDYHLKNQFDPEQVTLDAKKEVYRLLKEEGRTDDVVAKGVTNMQDRADRDNHPRDVWMAESGALGDVPAGSRSPYKNGAKVGTIYPKGWSGAAVVSEENGGGQEIEPAEHVPNAERHETIDNTDSAAHEQVVNTAPSDAQKEAGNYKKAHVKVDGMDITVENPAGSTRSGTDQDGKKWEVEMKSDYGYIKGSQGYDKDHVDVIIAPGYQGGGNDAYVVNQFANNGKGDFDEHKVVVGASSEEEALDIYNANYEEGWQGGKYITRVPMEEFREWAKSDGPKQGPLMRGNTQASHALLRDRNRDVQAERNSFTGTDKTPQQAPSSREKDERKEFPGSKLKAEIARYKAKMEDERREFPGRTGAETVTPAEQEAGGDTQPNIIEHTTKKGKVIRGIVRTDLTKEQAKAIDKFTFKKDGGWFIREKHLESIPEKETIDIEKDAVEIGKNIYGERIFAMKNSEQRFRLRTDRKDRPDGYIDFGGILATEEEVSEEGQSETKVDHMRELMRRDDAPNVNYSPGEKVTTATDRETTPFPEVDSSTAKKAANSIKKINRWLLLNAKLESESRGDDFAMRQFYEALQAKNPTIADLDFAKAYLFDKDFIQKPKDDEPTLIVHSLQTGKEEEIKLPPRETRKPEENPKGKPADYGASNKIFTADAAEKARQVLRAKLQNLNSGLDPETMQAGIMLAGYHIEAGARKFTDYAKAMIGDLGEGIRPFLRSFYEGVRYYPGIDGDGMSSAQEIDEYLADNEKAEADPMAADLKALSEVDEEIEHLYRLRECLSA